MQKLPIAELLTLLFSGDVLEFGWWDKPPAGYTPLPVDIDVPAINILTPYLGFSVKILGFGMKFFIRLK